ncbi:hypothetical protein ACTL6U_06075 [Rhodovibrionaceae bacterium A322]
MFTILLLGLLIGMQHALEVDHLAAVASIASGQKNVKKIITSGAVWGLGHTLTLMAFAGVVVTLGTELPPTLAEWLEGIVGVMLVGLGIHVLWRLWRDKVHFHLHRHGDGVVHFHAHSHKGETGEHSDSSHEHEHPPLLRTLLVGMMHGLAGSAALMVLTATTLPDLSWGFAYVTLFGVGSIFGMAALSAVIALPLVHTAKKLTWANNLLRGAVGTATIVLGALVISEASSVVFAAAS